MKKNKSHINKSGFKIPENFLEDFEEKMMRSVGEKPVLQDSYKNNSGFKVPDIYFDNLEKDVLQKVESQKKGGKLISLFNNKKLFYAVAVAAVFVGLISTVNLNPVSDNYTMGGVELSAIEQYIDEGYIDLNFNEISAFMADEDLSFEEFNTSGISDEQVLDYLSENIEDPNILYE